MKYTKYFEFTKLRPNRIGIKEDWIIKAYFNPIA